jgi:hypothetical protein
MPKKLLRAALFMGGTMPVAEGSGQGIRACGMPATGPGNRPNVTMVTGDSAGRRLIRAMAAERRRQGL